MGGMYLVSTYAIQNRVLASVFMEKKLRVPEGGVVFCEMVGC